MTGFVAVATDARLMRVLPGDPEYAARAEAEALFWSTTPSTFGVEPLEDAPGHVLDFYTNERFTGDGRTPWYEVIARNGGYRRGLTLGTAGIKQDARILAGNPALQMTYCDISEGALDRWRRDLGARFAGRVATQELDLNFGELPAGAFDLIVSSSSIHHISNLEHLAAQIDRALTPDGVFFLQDYVGEQRFRFSNEKRRLVAAVYGRVLAHREESCDLVWSNEDETQYSPFCAVRSDDILPVMRAYLDETEARTASALLLPLLCVQPAEIADRPFPAATRRSRITSAVRRRIAILRRHPVPDNFPDRELRELAWLDALICDTGLLLPGNAFVTYRKRR